MLFKKNTAKKEELVKKVKKETREWGEIFFPDVKEASFKARVLADMLDDPMNIYRISFSRDTTSALGQILSVVIDEEIPMTKLIAFTVGVMVVPTSNPNDHSYQLNKPFLIVTTKRTHAINSNGRRGNILPADNASVRPATDEEIDAFFEDFDMKVLEEYPRLLPE